jgi:hypothetical protein
MMLDFQTGVDFAGSLAVICLLAMAYGVVRRLLPGVSLASQLLGALFGMVAVLQMHAPITPAPGIVIDLRIVPISLAGAFLGGRGVLICVLIAAAGRLAIGGAGLASGIAAIILAGGGGLAWNALTIGPERRGLRTMMGLGAMMSVTFLTAVLLPMDIMLWFLTQAAPPMMLVYLTVIPAVGSLLERERTLMMSEARMRAAALAQPEVSFPPGHELERRLTQALAAGRLDRGAATLRLRFRPGLAQAAFWGEDNDDLVSDALYQRIHPLLPEGAEIGLLAPGHALVVAPADLTVALDNLAAHIRDEVLRNPISVPSFPAVPPRATVGRADHDSGLDLATLFDGESATRPMPPPPTASAAPEDLRLFDVAERLTAFHRDRAIDDVRRQFD